jgi:hypothetical protein
MVSKVLAKILVKKRTCAQAHWPWRWYQGQTSEPWRGAVESFIASYDSVELSHESVCASVESATCNDSLYYYINIVNAMYTSIAFLSTLLLNAYYYWKSLSGCVSSHFVSFVYIIMPYFTLIQCRHNLLSQCYTLAANKALINYYLTYVLCKCKSYSY